MAKVNILLDFRQLYDTHCDFNEDCLMLEEIKKNYIN